MRLARYSASDTYYPQTLSVLRLDRPRLTSADDDISSRCSTTAAITQARCDCPRLTGSRRSQSG